MAVFAALETLPKYFLTWKASIAEVGGDGDLGDTIGNYHMQFQGPGDIPVVIDGTCKIAIEMFNSNGCPSTHTRAFGSMETGIELLGDQLPWSGSVGKTGMIPRNAECRRWGGFGLPPNYGQGEDSWSRSSRSLSA